MGWAKRVVLVFFAIVLLLLLAAGLWAAGMRSGVGSNQIVVEINNPPHPTFSPGCWNH